MSNSILERAVVIGAGIGGLTADRLGDVVAPQAQRAQREPEVASRVMSMMAAT